MSVKLRFAEGSSLVVHEIMGTRSKQRDFVRFDAHLYSAPAPKTWFGRLRARVSQWFSPSEPLVLGLLAEVEFAGRVFSLAQPTYLYAHDDITLYFYNNGRSAIIVWTP